MHDFRSRFVQLETAATELPFTVGGVTQHGSHNPEQNNQDAMSLWVGDSSIIAIVCDGCAGPSPNGRNTVSFNETGAQLLSVLAIQTIRRLLSAGLQPGVDIVARIEGEICEKYMRIVSLLVGSDSFLREHVLFEVLMSTIVGAVITPERWCVFHGGDGLVIANDRKYDLTKHSGGYLANTIILKERSASPQAMLHLLEEGKPEELHSLLLGTDGVLDLINAPGKLLEDLVKKLDEHVSAYANGYDRFFFREFRKRVSHALFAQVQSRSEHDDRSLILIRRLSSGQVQSKGKKVSQMHRFGAEPSAVAIHAAPQGHTEDSAIEEGSDETEFADAWRPERIGDGLPIEEEHVGSLRPEAPSEPRVDRSKPSSEQAVMAGTCEDGDESGLDGCADCGTWPRQDNASPCEQVTFPDLDSCESGEQAEPIDALVLTIDRQDSAAEIEQDAVADTESIESPFTNRLVEPCPNEANDLRGSPAVPDKDSISGCKTERISE